MRTNACAHMCEHTHIQAHKPHKFWGFLWWDEFTPNLHKLKLLPAKCKTLNTLSQKKSLKHYSQAAQAFNEGCELSGLLKNSQRKASKGLFSQPEKHRAFNFLLLSWHSKRQSVSTQSSFNAASLFASLSIWLKINRQSEPNQKPTRGKHIKQVNVLKY